MLKCDDTAISLFFAPFDLVGSRKSSAGVIARQPDLDIITRFARWETRKFQKKTEKRRARARAAPPRRAAPGAMCRFLRGFGKIFGNARTRRSPTVSNNRESYHQFQ